MELKCHGHMKPSHPSPGHLTHALLFQHVCYLAFPLFHSCPLLTVNFWADPKIPKSGLSSLFFFTGLTYLWASYGGEVCSFGSGGV